MSTISASTTSNTAFKVTSDTTGTLVLQTGAVPTTAISIDASQVVSIGSIAVTGVTTFSAGSAAAPSITTTGDTNTGIFFPAADTIAFTEGGVESMRIDSSGNVGLGVTPSAFAGAGKNIQFGNGPASIGTQNSGDANFMHNAYESPAGTFKYVGSGIGALRYQLDINNNVHKWYYAASGTANNTISFTQAMTLDSSGRLGIGQTSIPTRLSVVSDTPTSSTLDAVFNVTNDVDSNFRVFVTGSGVADKRAAIGPTTNTALTFFTNNTERARIDSSGNLGLGVTPSAWATLVPAFQLGGGGTFLAARSTNPEMYLGTNAHYDGTNWKYKTSAVASLYAQDTGEHKWYRAASGTAGNTVTFTEFMRIDNNGDLGLGTTSITALGGNIRTLALQGASGAGIRLYGGATEYGRMYTVSTAMYIDSVTAIPMVFSTDNTERARITSGGAFFVGTTTGLYTAAGSINSVVSTVNDFCFAGSNSNSTNPRGLYLRNTNTTAGDYAIYFEASAATKFYVNGNGVIYSTNTSVQSVSDARHKENVRDLDKGLTEVLALKPRRFDWKEGKGTGAKDVAGFIAQEVETVLPELVGEWKETVDATEHYKSIAMTNVIPMLVKAIQELTARLAALESK